MNEQLLLKNIRDVLTRLEESIIFGFIERAQFAENATVYESGAFGDPAGADSLVGYLLHETEKIHARVRRYTSPDEHPFYDDLPEPVLSSLHFYENPLRPNRININGRIKKIYESDLIPRICAEGDDAQYGSSAVCDVNCLQTLSRRIHYGKFVAESKYQNAPNDYAPIIHSGDAAAIRRLITDVQVEENLLRRVERKAWTYGQRVDHQTADEPDTEAYKIPPQVIVDIYRDCIIPMTKDVEVAYLLTCRQGGGGEQ